MNPETDGLFGIEVNAIEKAASDGVGVMIPVTALVDADGEQLVFVQYENFYKNPCGSNYWYNRRRSLIQVTQELSIGEKLVTQDIYPFMQNTVKLKVQIQPEQPP